MKLFITVLVTLFSVPLVHSNHICDTYTTALFVNNTGDNQLALITTVVNLAVLGDPALNVPGILAAEGGLTPFFTGAAATTNRGGVAVSLNFLDGGSNQQVLLEHLYQFFGAVLACRAAGFPAYGGAVDMFEVHKFMVLNKTQNDYFITQVGLSAKALGVTDADVTAVGNLLQGLFNTRCPKPLTANETVATFLVGTNPSICHASTCPLDPDPDTTCSMPEQEEEPEEELGFFGRIFARIRAFFANLFG